MEKYFCLPAPNSHTESAFEVKLAGITYPTPYYSVERRSSDVFVVEHVVGGEGTVICAGQEYSLKKGDTYVLPIGMAHRYFSSRENPWTKKWMNVSGEICEKLTCAYGIENIVYFPDTDINSLFDDFFSFCENNNDADEINRRGALLFHSIVQQLSLKGKSIEMTAAAKIKNYIDTNIYTKLNADSVAKSMGFSVSQLGRIFKSEYDVTVYAYILDRKIDIAQNLLTDTTFTVKEISDMLNFTDEHYFCNIFKRKRNMTPKECRKGAK